MTSDTYYDVLGVPVDADADELRAAYRRKVKDLHPDLPANNPGMGGQDTTREMAAVNEAFGVLIDPARREEYDRTAGVHVPRRTRRHRTTWIDTYAFTESLGHERIGELFRTHPQLPQNVDLFWSLWRQAVRHQRRAHLPFDDREAFETTVARYRSEVEKG
jgi:curved DNA-binding protein CbpA